MKDHDAKQLDELLIAYALADREAHEACAQREYARRAVHDFVESRNVPAGTEPVDIPEFLRSDASKGPPQFPHAASLSPLKGCACGACNDARARARFAGNNSDA